MRQILESLGDRNGVELPRVGGAELGQLRGTSASPPRARPSSAPSAHRSASPSSGRSSTAGWRACSPKRSPENRCRRARARRSWPPTPCHRRTAARAAPVVLGAGFTAITDVFLFAVPVVLVAFVVAWFLKEDTLRGSVTAPDRAWRSRRTRSAVLARRGRPCPVGPRLPRGTAADLREDHREGGVRPAPRGQLAAAAHPTPWDGRARAARRCHAHADADHPPRRPHQLAERRLARREGLRLPLTEVGWRVPYGSPKPERSRCRSCSVTGGAPSG